MSDATNSELVDDENVIDGNTEVETDQDTGSDDQPGEVQLDDDGNPIGAEADADDEYEEVERGDKRYKIPKALKDDLLRQDDYTRKTQVHSEEVRRFEERVKTFEAASEEHLAAAIEAKAFKDRLAAINDLTDADWGQLQAMDRQDGGDRYNRLMRELSTLPSKLADAEAKSKAMREAVLKEQSEIQTKQLEQGHAILARDIPGWGPELGGKIAKAAADNYGITPEKHGAAFGDPALVKMAFDAFRYREAQRKAATTKKVETATQNPPPKTASRAAPATGLGGNLGTEEWIRRRNAQVAKKR